MLFTTFEIELLLCALDTWEATARNEIATRVNQEVTEKALQIMLDGTDETQQDIVARLTQENQSFYTPKMVRKIMRERNEPGALLKARLILMKKEVERDLMSRGESLIEELGEELFRRKEGDESDV